MGNGTSTDQGSFTPYGLRDVDRTDAEQRQHDWSNPEDDNKLAGAPDNEEINSLSTFNRKDGLAPTSHNGAQCGAGSSLFESTCSSLSKPLTPNSTDGFTHLRTKEDIQEDGTPPNSPENSSPDSTPAKPKKSTYTYGNASAGATACHAEERTVRGAEEGLSSLLLRSMRDDQVQSPTISSQQERSLLLEPNVRELAEFLRSPLPNYNVRELAGPPMNSLPSIGIQELAEPQQRRHHVAESNNFYTGNDNLPEVTEINRQPEPIEIYPTAHRRSEINNGFYYPPDISVQGNYVRGIVRVSVGRDVPCQQYADARLYQHGSSGQQSHNWPNSYLGDQHGNMYVCDQEGNLYEAQLYTQPNRNTDAMETTEVFHPRNGEAELNHRGICDNMTTGWPVIKPVSTRTPTDHPTELFEPTRSVYHTARTKREDSRYKKEPSADIEVRTKERKILFGTSDSEDDEAYEAKCCRTRKTRTDAKVGETQHLSRRSKSPATRTDAKVSKTQHLSRHPNGASKRAVDPVNAKVSLTRHSPAKKSNSSSRSLRHRTYSSRSQSRRRSSTSTPRSTSTQGRRRDYRRSSSQKISRKKIEQGSSSSASSSENEEDILATPKHILKPPKFDGQSSFETFMAQFSNCAEHNKWNEAQKLAYLHNLLEKEAANVLWDYGKDIIGSLSGLMNILETRFGGKAVAHKHQIELRNRRRRPNETLQRVHSDIRRLAALAYPSVPPQMREEITCDHFLDALRDPDFALKIRERQPADLDSALRIALQLEVWTEVTVRLREAAKLEKGGGRRVREISNKKPDPAIEALQKEMERIKKMVEFAHGTPRNPNNGGFPSNYRQPNSIRHTAPSSYHVGTAPVSALSTPWSSCGLNPANYGNSPSNFARPPGSYGMNRTGNFYRPPNLTPRCYRCIEPENVQCHPLSNEGPSSNRFHRNDHLHSSNRMSDL